MYENMVLVEKGFPKIGGMEFWAKRGPCNEGLLGGLWFDVSCHLEECHVLIDDRLDEVLWGWRAVFWVKM
jgi:hypothetical protein